MLHRVQRAVVGLVRVDELGERMSVPPEVEAKATMLRDQKVHAHASGKRWRCFHGAFHRSHYHSRFGASDPVHSAPQGQGKAHSERWNTMKHFTMIH